MLKQEFAGNPLDRGRSRGLWWNRAEDIIEANVRRNGGKKRRKKKENGDALSPEQNMAHVTSRGTIRTADRVQAEIGRAHV